MADRDFLLTQTIITNIKPEQTFRVVVRHGSSLTPDLFETLLASSAGKCVAVAPAFGQHCRIVALAFATPIMALVVHLSVSHAKKKCSSLPTLLSTILSDKSVIKVVLRADRLAAGLHLDFSQPLRNAFDLFSLSAEAEQKLNAVPFLLSHIGIKRVDRHGLKGAFGNEKFERAEEVGTRAWLLSYLAAEQGPLVVSRGQKVDTAKLSPQFLRALSETVRSADQKYAMKPSVTKNDIKPNATYKDGKLRVQCDRYKSRLRPMTGQTIHVTTPSQDAKQGLVARVKGREAEINIAPVNGDQPLEIRTIGKDPLTNAEAMRQHIAWIAFHQKTTLERVPFFRAIWYSEKRPKRGANARKPAIHFQPDRPLNQSQNAAVHAILSKSPSDKVTLIHGPPGTGKTTVIAATVCTISVSEPQRSVWLIAHSNVAVKNIAEKLADVGFLNFRILVSKDFHFDWHEHLYEKLESKVIVSDRFQDDIVGAASQLSGAQVVLCTLSMLSNNHIGPFTRLLPVKTVIIDEASQIEIGDYLPLINNFCDLEKLVFIGDDKQLPPFGQEDIASLRSIFEVPSLRANAIFLDTQYRMPHVVGKFISSHVYGGKLKTTHALTHWEVCRFVDVHKGVEKSSGHSWVNDEEAKAVVKVAQNLHKERKPFKIITPYDPQRTLIENELKISGIPWEDTCFNVDSFQGNEADHIIVSVVRSQKLGFLSNFRRSNVMLSRCKQGMIICSSRAFLGGVGANSLAGQLASECGDRAWISWQQVLNW